MLFAGHELRRLSPLQCRCMLLLGAFFDGCLCEDEDDGDHADDTDDSDDDDDGDNDDDDAA